MAETVFETDDPLALKAWSEKMRRSIEKDYFFSSYMGTSVKDIVYKQEELSKGAGDKVTIGLFANLKGEGKTGNQQLEGYEEDVVTHSDAVELEQYRHATRRKGRLTKKRVLFAIDSVHQELIRKWGKEKKEQLCVDALVSSPTRVVYQVSGTFTVASGGSAATTAAAAMHATNTVITPKLITQARTYAKTGGNRAFEPLQPVNIKGKDYFVLLVPEDVLNDLFNNSDIMSVHREARERDIDNPLFQSADIIYNGVLIRGFERMPTSATGGGAAVNYGKCALLGAQALAWADGEKEDVVMETFDYKNQMGWAWHIVCGVKKPVFNSEDYGSLGFYVACSNISGA